MDLIRFSSTCSTENVRSAQKSHKVRSVFDLVANSIEFNPRFKFDWIQLSSINYTGFILESISNNDGNGNENHTKQEQEQEQAEQWLYTCVLYTSILCRPLQNNNVK